ncbi:MAG: NADH-quinone oxidoreductase subunit M [Bacteroidales bacterium]
MIAVILILLPLFFLFVVFFLKNKNLARNISLVSSLLSLAVSLYAFITFKTSEKINFYYQGSWVNSLGINFEFGLDGVSMLMILLVSIVVLMVIISTFSRNIFGAENFYGLVLLMQAALVGVFSSLDALLFYIFWEIALVPIYFICLTWGSENRVKITLKFFIYTLSGSLFMLLAIIYLYTLTPEPHHFSLSEIYKLSLEPEQQYWLFGAFFLALAIKIPVFPFHSWQPDTYSVAPNTGSMLLAGLMPKMGLFGIIRFIIPLCPVALEKFGFYAVSLSLVGLLYGAVIAIRQNDLKRLIAFSSLSHVGLMAAALFSLNQVAISGSVIQMFAHGINVVGMFFIADVIMNRTETTKINELGGIAKQAPRLAVLFMVVMLANIALPLTNGFVGEFLMLGGLFSYNYMVAGFAGLSIIFSAAYMLWLYQKALFGETGEKSGLFKDIEKSEFILAMLIIGIIMITGIFPSVVSNLINPAVFTFLN